MSGLSVIPYQRSQRKATACINTVNEVGSPLDFSFCRYANIEEAIDEEPRSSPRKASKNQDDTSKCLTKSVKLNNNNLVDVSALKAVVEAHGISPDDIEFIDLSFNELTTIDETMIKDFSRLKILYFHGNSIEEIKELNKLKSLKHLQKLTLHGNPMDNKTKNYRSTVISMLPSLRNLDLSLITKADRSTSLNITKMTCANTKKKKIDTEDED